MNQFLSRTVARLGSWAIGLLLAAAVVPHVSVSTTGFIVAVVFFAVVQTLLSSLILKLPHGFASLVLGACGLAMTFVALSVASVPTDGLCIRGFASWLAAAVVIWLVTTIGAILLPDVYFRTGVGST